MVGRESRHGAAARRVAHRGLRRDNFRDLSEILREDREVVKVHDAIQIKVRVDHARRRRFANRPQSQLRESGGRRESVL